MIVVTVARKPCAESTVAGNALANGCGAMNINATRVAGVPELPGSSNIGKEDSNVYMTGFNATAGRRAEAYRANPPSGRWPANLILEHWDECVCVGEKKVKNEGGIPRTSVVKSHSINVQNSHAHTGFTHYFDADGLETVTSWECASGCPVAALDTQTGDLAPQGGQKKQDTGDKSFFSTGYGGAPDSTFYGDKGGASRFFKQVKS